VPQVDLTVGEIVSQVSQVSQVGPGS